MPQSGGQARVKVAQWAHWHRSQSRLLTSLSLYRNTQESVVVFCSPPPPILKLKICLSASPPGTIFAAVCLFSDSVTMPRLGTCQLLPQDIQGLLNVDKML